MKNIRIKDLYTGKPDAKDEVNFESPEKFIKTFVVADHFNLDSLTKGTNCFITGFKGTGKTALLFYLDDKIRKEDPQACTSYILFKEDFTETRRNEMQGISQKVLSSITVSNDTLVGTTEFEYIWRWLFFKQIVADNETYNRNLFQDNEAWKKFEKIISRILEPKNKRKFQIPNSIKLAMPVKDPMSQTEVTPEVQVDFRKQDSDQYQDFIELVDSAEKAFMSLTKTDIPYYIFVDELEAYYGDPNVFSRDLYMIRDLIFTVKRINTVLAKVNVMNTKIICSVRTEIINAISRFIVTKEINKVIYGFSLPLNWNYSNDNSYAHPIVQIILKRIAICAEAEGESSLEIYRKWFPEKIHDIEAASYILNNSWFKPRDMIRLLISAQNGLFNESSTFSTAVFDSIAKSYSEDSLQEIKEELRALYTSEQIECIVSCLTGFKTVFSISDLKKRISDFYQGTIWDTQFVQVLTDLYRLGVIGNYLPASRTYHWQHRGDQNLIMSDEWRICVHLALYAALSLNTRIDYGQNRGNDPQVGDVSRIAEIEGMNRRFLKVRFSLYGKDFHGQIHISEVGRVKDKYIAALEDEYKIGDEIIVKVERYNAERRIWDLGIVSE